MRVTDEMVEAAVKAHYSAWGTAKKSQDMYRDAMRAALEAVIPLSDPAAWQWLDTANFRKAIPESSNPSEWNPLYRHPAISHAAGQEAPINPAEIDRKLVGGEAVAWMRRNVTYKAVDGRTDGERVVSERKVYDDDLPLYLTPAQPPASAEVGGANCKRFEVYERVVWTSKFGTKFCGAVRHINEPEPLSYFVDLDDGTSVQRAMPSDLASSGRKGDEMP